MPPPAVIGAFMAAKVLSPQIRPADLALSMSTFPPRLATARRLSPTSVGLATIGPANWLALHSCPTTY